MLLILIGTRRSLQAPFVIGAATGATYERRLTQAKQATRWISSLR
ncbi:hypothetical protein AB0L64_16110 [Kribbella sp. NPDC051936]